MYKNLRVAVVVPAYNESAHIAAVIKRMPALVDHVIVIDNASSDGTYDLAVAAADQRTEVIRHEVNKGVGGAIVTGHRAAMELGADVKWSWPAMPRWTRIPARALDRIAEADTASPRRIASSPLSRSQGMPNYRMFGNIVLSFMTKVASGYWNLFDPQNGYTAIRDRGAARHPLDSVSGATASRTTCSSASTSCRWARSTCRFPRCTARRSRASASTSDSRDCWSCSSAASGGASGTSYVLWSFSPMALLLFAGTAAVPGAGRRDMGVLPASPVPWSAHDWDGHARRALPL